MLIWVRNIVIIFAILSIIYALLSATANIRQRHKLSSDYKTYKGSESKSEFIENGLKDYNRSIKPKMLLGIYLIPLIVTVALISLAQYG